MYANLQAELAANPNPARMLELVQINNQIAQLNYDLAKDIPVKLNEEKKVEYDARVKSHTKKLDDLKSHQGKVYDNEEEKVENDARVKSHNKKLDDLKLHRGKVYMLIWGSVPSNYKTN